MLLLEIKLVRPEQVELIPNSREGVWDGWVVGVVKDRPREEIPWASLPRDCFLRFVNDLGDPNRSRAISEMVKLVREFGPLQKGHFDPPLESRRAMKVWNSLESKRMKRFATPLADMGAHHSMFYVAVTIWNLLAQGKFKEAEALVPERLRGLEGMDPQPWLEGLMSANLREAKVRVSVAKRGDSILVNSAIVFESLLPGLWAQFWQEIAANPDLAQCEKCSRWFRREREIKRYCSLTCQQADKQRRYRDRLAAAEKKKKRKEKRRR